MFWVGVPLVFVVGYFSGYRRGYLKALEQHVADLKAFAAETERRV